MNILMRKTSDKTQDSGIRSMGLFCILCLVFLIPTAIAQEAAVRIEVKMGEVEDSDNVIIETDDDDVIIETREIIYNDSDAEEEQAMDSDEPAPRERGFGQDRRNREDGARQPRQREGGRQRPGGRLPPAVREMMEKENISPEDLRDPDIRKKVFEKARRMRMEAEEGSPPDENSAEEKQKKPENESEKKGLEGYMAVIDKKNLFRPLGSGDEKRKSSFALTAVISGSEDRAIIEETGGGRSFYVAKGETFADEIEVVDIGEQVVKLDRSGEEEELRLGEGTSGGRRGGGRSGRRGGRSPSAGGKPSGGGSDRGGGSDFNVDDIPPFARRMLEQRGISIEDLKNNPELQKKLRTEFEQRFGGGGGDRRPQPVMIQGGRTGGRQRGGNRRPRR